MEPTIIDAERGTRLSSAMDGAAMAAVFARQLTGTPATVISCAVSRYRHRPGRRCLIQYAVRVRDAAGVERVERVTGQWHHAPGYSARLHRQLTRRTARAQASWSGTFRPAFFDQDSGMLATTFPWDRRLHALPEVASGTSVALLTPMLHWMGTSVDRIEHVAVDPVRYREQLSAVCRYAVRARFAAGAWHRATFYTKTYPTDEGVQAAAQLSALAAATSARPGSARVQPPVAYVEGLRTLVLAAAPGSPVDAHPSFDRPSVMARLALVAGAVAQFGRCDARLPGRPRDTSASTDRTMRALAASSVYGGVLSSLDAWATARSQAGDFGVTHGDLKLEHVFVDGRTVWLIDADSVHRGDPVWDLALLRARWWAAYDIGDARRPLRDAGAEVLTRTYLGLVPAGWATRLPPLQVRALLDVAAGIVKRCEPEAAARAGRLIEQAQVVAGVRR